MNTRRVDTKTLVFVAMMGAVSTVLMMLEFSLPLAPSFLKLDISELPALFAGFFLGPVSGCAVIIIKIVLKLLTRGTNTVFVGEVMNMIGSMCFVLPASLIYKYKHTKKGAITSLVVGSIVASVAYVFLNLFISFPLYAKLYGIPMDALIGMGTAITPLIKDLPTMMLFSVLPFNIVKHAIVSLITYVIYKRVGRHLRNMLGTSARTSK